MPVYHSSNHNNYSALVAQDISDISNEHAAGNMTDRQARDAVRKVQMDYKNRIWSGDVPKDCKGRLN